MCKLVEICVVGFGSLIVAKFSVEELEEIIDAFHLVVLVLEDLFST